MSKVFLISDLHLGHHKIIKYQSRPFADVDEMWVCIRDNWNREVRLFIKIILQCFYNIYFDIEVVPAKLLQGTNSITKFGIITIFPIS